MKNKLEHFLFRNYTKAIKQFLIDACWLSRYPEDENVGVYYTTPPRAFANFIRPAINGKQLNPLVTFDLTSFNHTIESTPNLFVERYVSNDDSTFQVHKGPIPYELQYRVTIWTHLQSDMDILLYQILSLTPRNRKYAVGVDTQWAEIYSEGPAKETQLEPGESQDIAHRYGLTLNIPRAYLPLEYTLYRGRIETIDLSYGTSYDYDI